MYESYYGISEKPFQLTPDPRYFFSGESHRRAMHYLRYGLTLGEGFIVVTGPVGTGKSTLVRNLVAELEKDNIETAIITNTSVSPLELLRLVAEGIHAPLAGTNKAQLLSAIERQLSLLNRTGKRALLLIDEAQNLPAESIEELRMLSNFQRNDKPLVQSFLLGQEELRDTIQGEGMEQFRQRIIASCHLQPLSADETGQYIQHRLEYAGWKNEFGFADGAFALIYQHSDGVPRKINKFCDRLLLYGYLEKLQQFSCDAVELVAADIATENGSKDPVAEKRTGSSPQNRSAPAPSLPSGQAVEQAQEVMLSISGYLDEMLVEKVKTLKRLDEAINAKAEQLKKLEKIISGKEK